MTRVVQNVHARAGTELAHLVGEFVWHPTHDHWHFAGFSIYELWTLAPSGALDEIISSSDKVSYCVIDTDIIDYQDRSFAPRRGYYGCGKALQDYRQGGGILTSHSWMGRRSTWLGLRMASMLSSQRPIPTAACSKPIILTMLRCST